MTIDDHSALDIATWYDRLGHFASDLTTAHADIARHIRKAYYLQCLAPPALRPLMTVPIEEALLEAMLESGAFERAARSVTGIDESTVPRSVSNAPTSGCPVETGSLAMLIAWAASLQRLRPRPH